MHLTNLQVIVDRVTALAMMGDLQRASAEVLRLEDYVAVFNKSKDLL